MNTIKLAGAAALNAVALTLLGACGGEAETAAPITTQAGCEAAGHMWSVEEQDCWLGY